MALLWAYLFNGVTPDQYDIIGAVVSIVGVGIIYYVPRKSERDKTAASKLKP